jgi:Zn-dependent M28 family amino/carboxypeptidase
MRHLCFLVTLSLLATEPNAATRRWWAHTQALANDKMAGRDTGSEAYDRAASYVVREFTRLGLRPAGTLGYYQQVPMRRARLVAAESEAMLGPRQVKLDWFRQINVPVRQGMPVAFDAPLVFEGSEPIPAAGKIAVSLGAPRFIPGQKPYTGTAPADAVATLVIPSTRGPEPQRWPVAYSVAVSIDGAEAAPQPSGAARAGAGTAFSFNPADAELLFAGSGHTFAQLLSLAESGGPLPSFPLATTLRVKLKVSNEFLASDNILGILPGSDPALASEYVAVSAHLDGYGPGEPWKGDGIYNGAFDDAAYVATLLDFAEHLRESHRTLKRSVLFCVFTGEEKGLLGSKYFAAHPTVPKTSMVADVNLDMLRPIFPLKILTALALEESSLGLTARGVAEKMGIRVQPDLETERGLMRRSDHFSFMQIGVPSIGFLFGYEKGSPEEAVFRKWYAERYHTPADDLQQPWVPEAAAKFNAFFERLVETVANTPERPKWSAGSTYAK